MKKQASNTHDNLRKGGVNPHLIVYQDSLTENPSNLQRFISGFVGYLCGGVLDLLGFREFIAAVLIPAVLRFHCGSPNSSIHVLRVTLLSLARLSLALLLDRNTHNLNLHKHLSEEIIFIRFQFRNIRILGVGGVGRPKGARVERFI